MGMSAITLIQIRFHDAERDALDNYRRQQLNPPSCARRAKPARWAATWKAATRSSRRLSATFE
jgi:hypothetical protein